MSEPPKEQTPAPTPPPSKPKKKRTVLEQLKIRSKERATGAANVPRPGVKLPTVPKSPPAPKTLAPAELIAAAQPPVLVNPAPPVNAEAPDTPIEGSVLELLFARAMRARSDTKPANDPGMAMIQALGHQVQHGQPLKDIEDIVVPQLGEMSSKIHLFLNALAYHNMFERGSMLSLARWTLEKSLWEDLIGQKLSPVEKLALLQLAIKEMDKVTTNLGAFQHSLEGGGKGTANDIESASQRADRTLVKIVDPNAKDLVGTTPIGRELARRMADKAAKAGEKLVAESMKKP